LSPLAVPVHVVLTPAVTHLVCPADAVGAVDDGDAGRDVAALAAGRASAASAPVAVITVARRAARPRRRTMNI
jgi:hypothetical protein